MNIPKVWEWLKENWDKFSENMKKVSYIIPSTITNDACEDRLGIFYKTLYSAIQKSIPKNFCSICFLVDYFSPESGKNNINICVPIKQYPLLIYRAVARVEPSHQNSSWNRGSYPSTTWCAEEKSALLKYLRLIGNKTRKENLKPRK